MAFFSKWTTGSIGTALVLILSVLLWWQKHDGLYGLREGIIALVAAGIIATVVTNMSRNETLGVATYLVSGTLIVFVLAGGTSPNTAVVTTIYEHGADPSHFKATQTCILDEQQRIVCDAAD